MNSQNVKSSYKTPAPKNSPTIDVFCRLFNDMVPMNICHLRRKELDTFGWNTCSGCAAGLLQYWSAGKAGE